MVKLLIQKGIFPLVISLTEKTRFLAVGAQRCGTTSLFFYLSKHPDIYLSPMKETNFFSLLADNTPEKMWAHPLLEAQPKLIEEYERLFVDIEAQQVVGEVTPLYIYHPLTARKIHEYIPDAKIIICLRHPIERAFSAFRFERNWKREKNRDFRKAIASQQSILKNTDHWWEFLLQSGVSTPYLEGSLYYQQVKRYFDLFPRDQIYLYLFEDLQWNNQQIMNDIFNFLGLESITIKGDVHNDRQSPYRNMVISTFGILQPFIPFYKFVTPKGFRQSMFRSLMRVAESHGSKQMKMSDREWLIEQLRDDVVKLSSLIERDLVHWTI